MLRGEAAYDEPASCIQTDNAVANVTDGRGDGVMEITDGTRDSTARWHTARNRCEPASEKPPSSGIPLPFPTRGLNWGNNSIHYSEWDTGPIFRSQENKFKGVDTDRKWGSWDTLVNYVGGFPFSNHNILTYCGQNRHNIHIQNCLQRTIAGVRWAPCLFTWLRTFSEFRSDFGGRVSWTGSLNPHAL